MTTRTLIISFQIFPFQPKMSTVRSISTVSRPPDAARQPTNLPSSGKTVCIDQSWLLNTKGLFVT